VIGNTATTRIKSLGVAGLTSSAGPTVVWMIRGDGTLWDPWSIVDAAIFTLTPHRGNLFGIGDNFHLVEYVAP